MNALKNTHRLTDISAEDLAKMELAAKDQNQLSNISFKITEYSEEMIIIQIVQDKLSTGIYYTQKQLIEITHEIFDLFFPGKKVHVHAITYVNTPVNNVNIHWINIKMLLTQTRTKQIVNDTGIDTTTIKNIIAGNVELTQPLKALFYYYFLNRELNP